VYAGSEKSMKIRVRFVKRDAVRFSSHKDVVRAFQRGFAAAGIPVSYSRGYHPHMRMSFGPPLKTGWEGLDEYMDVQIDEPVAKFESKCNRFLPDGLAVLGSAPLAEGIPKLANDICAATYQVRFNAVEGAGVRTDPDEVLNRTRFSKQSSADPAAKTGGDGPRITGIEIARDDSDVRIEYTSTMLSGRVVAPRDVLAVVAGAPEALEAPGKVTRTRQYVARDGVYVSPLSREVTQGLS
jgi:radical SAM-linked protein